MEGRAKVTKEVLCEEARFILANVMAEARYGGQWWTVWVVRFGKL